MPNPLDLSQRRFGSLVAIEPTEHTWRGYVMWMCQCDCGRRALASTRDLVGGRKYFCTQLVHGHPRRRKRPGPEHHTAPSTDHTAPSVEQTSDEH